MDWWVYLSPKDSADISSGATFFQRRGVGRQDRQFPSLISEHYEQWSYLSITDTKAANEKDIGAFSAENTVLQGISTEAQTKPPLPCTTKQRVRKRFVSPRCSKDHC